MKKSDIKLQNQGKLITVSQLRAELLKHSDYEFVYVKFYDYKESAALLNKKIEIKNLSGYKTSHSPTFILKGPKKILKKYKNKKQHNSKLKLYE